MKESWFERNGLTIGTVITMIIFLMSSLVGITVFAFTTFATKDAIEKRLDKIESEIHDLNSYLRDRNKEN